MCSGKIYRRMKIFNGTIISYMKIIQRSSAMSGTSATLHEAQLNTTEINV